MRPTAGLSTRDAILLEAQHCFAEQGFDGTSLNDIAAGVGIRKTSLLHHFPPRRRSTERSSSRRSRTGSGGSRPPSRCPDLEGWSKVDHVVTAAFDFFRANPEFVRIMQREALDGQGHLGVDLGTGAQAVLRAGGRLLRARDGRGPLPQARPRAADHHRLRRHPRLLQRRAVLGRRARPRPPRDDDFLDARLEHLRDFFLARRSSRSTQVASRPSRDGVEGEAAPGRRWRSVVLDGAAARTSQVPSSAWPRQDADRARGHHRDGRTAGRPASGRPCRGSCRRTARRRGRRGP